MSELPTELLFLLLGLLILLSAFFSGSETGMMALNRYRLRTLLEEGNRSAELASALLRRPDRLIGLILLGNNFVNILASAVATLLGLRLLGEAGLAIATGLLTLVILIFAEVLPKTVAALHPEGVALKSVWLLTPLLRLLYPLVWTVNLVTNSMLRLLGVRPEGGGQSPLSREELRTVLKEAGSLLPRRTEQMLGILELEEVTVEDIMVPRSEVFGIDLEDDTQRILDQLSAYRHSRVPVYRENLDGILGILHIRNVPRVIELIERGEKEGITRYLEEPYFIPDSTPLHTQLFNFQQNRKRLALVVDEYGDIIGLVTLEDILEEIVGEYTTGASPLDRNIIPQKDGSYLIEGGTTLREIARALGWKLPSEEAKTLNGLVLEQLESIPEPGISLRVGNIIIEVLQVSGQQVKTARCRPIREEQEEDPADERES